MRYAAALGIVLAMSCGSALADPQAECKAAAGTYLTGKVTSGPRFQRGGLRYGVELSHTHVRVQSDQDRRSYDVAIDNVFAAGYDQASGVVPAPLDQLQVGTRVELCGQPYTTGVGIHWVHTNCNETPTRDKPDGWVRIIASDGKRGDNLESNQKYCNLWPQ